MTWDTQWYERGYDTPRDAWLASLDAGQRAAVDLLAVWGIELRPNTDDHRAPDPDQDHVMALLRDSLDVWRVSSVVTGLDLPRGLQGSVVPIMCGYLVQVCTVAARKLRGDPPGGDLPWWTPPAT